MGTVLNEWEYDNLSRLIKSVYLGSEHPLRPLYRINGELFEVCQEPLWGFGEQIGDTVYCYDRREQGLVYILPKIDFDLIYLEFPDFIVDKRREYEWLDNKGVWYTTAESNQMCYKNFLTKYTYAFHTQNSDVNLKLKYTKFNKDILGGILPLDVCVRWNSRLTGCAGKCRLRSICYDNRSKRFATIELSPHYHERFDEIDNTLIHEMVHILLPRHNHDREFMAMINRISLYSGIQIDRFSKEKAKPNWYYVCFDCQFTVKRAKRLASNRYYSCPECETRLTEYSKDEYESD